MSIKLRVFLFLIIILLAGCNYPQAESKQLPIDTEKPPAEISTTAPPLQVTDTPQPDSSDGSTDPDSPPIEPTKDMTQVLAGDLIPIFPAGTDIIIHEWQDVTPPQPLVTGDPGFTTVDLGIWDVNTAWVNYAGSDLIWTTTNGGVNWDVVPVIYETRGSALFTVLDENHAWAFQFLDAGMQKVYTALIQTSDGGDTWNLLLDPHLLLYQISLIMEPVDCMIRILDQQNKDHLDCPACTLRMIKVWSGISCIRPVMGELPGISWMHPEVKFFISMSQSCMLWPETYTAPMMVVKIGNT